MNSQEILQQVNDFIARMPYNREPQALYEPVKYVLSLGGKRIRPVLMMLAYNIWRDCPQDILPQAVGLETYHNYTLLHDDLMDRAEVRRGQPTVHRRWNDNQAILSGDTMLVMAYQLMAEGLTDKLNPVISLFTETALEIGEGQQYDIDFELRNDVSEEEYIEMIRLKTSVLLACALKIGALLADAPAEDAEQLYCFGEQLGLAFQLQDDYLDVYGDPAVFGKAIGGDILCNKKTYMLINAMRLADARQLAELNRWLADEQPDAQQKIAAVTRIYNETGTDRLAIDKINHYFDEALETLSGLNVASERKQHLLDYAHKMMKRKK